MRATRSAAFRLLAGATLAGLTSACAIPLYKHSVDDCPTTTLDSSDRVTVQFLGVGGFLISHGADVVLTAPLYSNPSLVEVLADHEVRTDSDLVDRLLPTGAGQAAAIIVGHSHYDHLMDVPYVALRKAKAKIYGSDTTAKLLAPIAAELAAAGSGVVALDGQAHVPGKQQGVWVPVSPTIRLMAIRSQHSDQLVAKVPFGPTLPLHLGRGPAVLPSKELPRTPSQWAEGAVFSYVIDFLDAKGAPIFRVYYQDSGTDQGVGFLPEHVKQDGKAVDLALLCLGGSFDRLDTHPSGILLDTRPRFALLGHWEDFFVTQASYCVDDRSTGADERGIGGIPGASGKFLGKWRKSDTERFVDLVERTIEDHHLPTRAWLPCPTRSRFELPLAGDTSVPRAGRAPGCPSSR